MAVRPTGLPAAVTASARPSFLITVIAFGCSKGDGQRESADSGTGDYDRL